MIRNTIDGFGIETVLIDGESFLLQRAGSDEWRHIQYSSPEYAASAFAYVEARAHYGVSIARV